jgi:diguanylate cyclase (GGDEF)-like protein
MSERPLGNKFNPRAKIRSAGDLGVLAREIKSFRRSLESSIQGLQRSFVFPGAIRYDSGLLKKEEKRFEEWRALLRKGPWELSGFLSEIRTAFRNLVDQVDRFSKGAIPQQGASSHQEYVRLFGEGKDHADGGFYGILRERLETLEDRIREVQLSLSLMNGVQIRLFCEEPAGQGRQKTGPSTLLVVDIDRFEEIHVRFGSAVGEVVLRDIEAILRKNIRREEWGAIFLLGEARFVVAVRADFQGAASLAERLRAIVERQFADGTIFRGRYFELGTTVSIGISLCSDLGDPNEAFVEALQMANARMYRARDSGQNRVEGPENSLATDPSLLSTVCS